MKNNNQQLKSTCFLCSSQGNITKEHVFPKWVLDKYNLKKQKISLVNKTLISYGKLTIPCCKQCNTNYLSGIETKISKLVNDDDLKSLRQNTDELAIWLYKIMYGLQYKELFLKNDIKSPVSNPIRDSKEFLENNIMSRLFLNVIHKDTIFNNFKPYSIFIFKLEKNIKNDYFYVDISNKLVSSIVLGDIGIIASFQCDGYIRDILIKNFNINEDKIFTLHEFADISAFIFHLKQRMKMLPNYFIRIDENKTVVNIQEPEDKKLFNEFNKEQHLEILKLFQVFFEELIEINNNVRIIKYKSPFTYF